MSTTSRVSMPALMSLMSYAAANGLLLFGKPDFAHAAFADQFKETIWTNDGFEYIGFGRISGRRFENWVLQKASSARIGIEQRLHFFPQFAVTPALPVQKGGALPWIELQRRPKQLLYQLSLTRHDSQPKSEVTRMRMTVRDCPLQEFGGYSGHSQDNTELISDRKQK